MLAKIFKTVINNKMLLLFYILFKKMTHGLILIIGIFKIIF